MRRFWTVSGVVLVALGALNCPFLPISGVVSDARAETSVDAAQAASETPAVSSQADREAFVHHFAEVVMIILSDPKKKYDDRKDMLRNAFNKSVDMDWMAKFVLASSWNKASPEERDRYTSLYRHFLTETYVSNFAENPDKRIRDIEVLDVSETKDPNFSVRTQMVLMNNDTLNVNYLVHEENGKYKVRDIAIENVSLINTHRAELGKIAQIKGIPAVIATLEQTSDKDKPTIRLSMNP